MDQEHVTRWQVGVLRSGHENVAWVSGGAAPDWGQARAATIAAVRELVAVEGAGEYWLRIDEVEGIVKPVLASDGEVLLGDLERLIPAAWPTDDHAGFDSSFG